MSVRTCILLFFVCFPIACQEKVNPEKEQVVAKVYNSLLYPSDLAGQIGNGLPAQDSIMIAKRLIEEWVKNKLLLRQAEAQLPAAEKEIQKQVDEYRSSLLIYKYKQNLLNTNLDPTVSEKEIEEYYKENSSNYLLVADLVKINLVKIPSNSSGLNLVKLWYRSENEEDLSSLQKYCALNSLEYTIKSEWKKFSDILEIIPLKIDDPGKFLNFNKNIETKDSEFNYFVHIIDHIKEGQVSPLEIVHDDVRSVLMNKRKVQYIKDLENTIYREGLSRHQVKIY